MKWKTKKRSEWHRWFAWYPVVTTTYNTLGGNKYAWLCFVERKLMQQTGGVRAHYRTEILR
jgi:hypothetical protein